MKTPILGASYVADTPSAACNRMVNLFPESIIEGGKETAYLRRAPGRRLLTTVGTGPIRGLWKIGDFFYVVSGTKLYKVDVLYNSTELGTLYGTVEPVSMADNGTQLFIACGGPSYIYNTSSGVFQQIVDPDFEGAVTVGYVDGYFIYNSPGGQKVWASDLLEGTQVDALSFASAEASPDQLVAVAIDHSEAWLFGKNVTEVWGDAALQDFPLSRIQGALIEIGCDASFSIAKLDNSLFWLGSDDRGTGVIYRSNGYQGQRVSTHYIETKIRSFQDISNAVAYSYQQDGHSFYIITFPNTNFTFAYDVASGLWTERASFVNGEFTRVRDNCRLVFNREVIVGDYQNGKLYALDPDVYDDAGSVLKWLRSWRALPTEHTNYKRKTQHSLQIDFEAGVGLNSGQGSDPQVFLRWSDDSGKTWSNFHWRSLGRIGEYAKRVIWRRLGVTEKLRDRVYEISGTDPVKISIMGAELDMGDTNA